jgi:hypothetical protein
MPLVIFFVSLYLSEFIRPVSPDPHIDTQPMGRMEVKDCKKVEKSSVFVSETDRECLPVVLILILKNKAKCGILVSEEEWKKEKLRFAGGKVRCAH